MCSTYNPLLVANNILERANNDKDIIITPMKLQKLLYFIYSEYLRNTGRSLFAERFETWRYGPVLACVYDEFKKYKDKHIKNFYKDNTGRYLKINEETDFEFKKALELVWQKYKDYNGIQLSELTHKKDTAWYKARVDEKSFLSDDDIANEVLEDI